MMTLDFPTFSCTDKLVHRNIQRVSPRKVGKYEIQKYSKANAADLSNVENLPNVENMEMFYRQTQATAVPPSLQWAL